MARELNSKVPSNRTIVGVCAAGVIVFGGLTAAGFAQSPVNPGAIVTLAVMLVGAGGIIIFSSLDRASSHLRALEGGKNLIAEGQGRMAGAITILVVGATSQRVIAVSGPVIGKPRILASIPYGDVLEFDVGRDSLTIRGRIDKIALVKCPPSQVMALAAELRSHVSG